MPEINNFRKEVKRKMMPCQKILLSEGDWNDAGLNNYFFNSRRATQRRFIPEGRVETSRKTIDGMQIYVHKQCLK